MSHHHQPPHSSTGLTGLITRGLITRPQADAGRFAVDLEARGMEPIIAPMLDIIPSPAPPDLASHLGAAQALLFTSANGVRALAALSPPFERPVFTVGAATAAAAREAGFSRVESADGAASDLVRLVIERLDPEAGPLFHGAGTVGGGSLRQNLRKAGFGVQRVPLYQARIPPRLPDPARQALAQAAQTKTMAFFFSPRTARAFVKLVKKAGLDHACHHITACALSAAAAEPLNCFDWRKIAIASRPDSAALLDCLAGVLERQR